MSTKSELLLSKWANAKAFLVGGEVCGDFSLGGNSEDDNEQFLEFHVYGSFSKKSDFYVEKAQLDKGILTKDGVTIDYYGEELEIVPLGVLS